MDDPGKRNCEEYIIEKGDYLIFTLKNWQSKIESIKDIFYQLLQHGDADKSKCIE